MDNIQQNFQYMGLLNQFTTGNPFIDPLLHAIIYSIIGTFIFSFKEISKYVFERLKHVLCRLYGNLIYYCYTQKSLIITKTININYITSQKKINMLYKAVEWFLATKLNQDYIRDTPLELSYDQDLYDIPFEEIETIMSNIKINDDIYKTFEYNGHKICYYMENSLLTVYTDKERRRENYTITLTTRMKATDKVDILKKFCDDCLRKYVKSLRIDEDKSQIFINTKNNKWESQDFSNKRNIKTVILQDGQIQDIIDDLDDFMNNKDWYIQKGIPYTRGYLFYGPPGTGKTSLIKGISAYTSRNIHYLVLKNVSSDEHLIKLLGKIDYDKTVLVIEDIDCMTDIILERKNNERIREEILKKELNQIKKDINALALNKEVNKDNDNKELTLSGILNAIDGIFNNEGRIMIITTNHPEKIDKALVRPGRIDKKVHFDLCTRKQICDIYNMMYGLELNINNINKKYNKMFSPAEIMALFLIYKRNPELAKENLDRIQKDILPINNSICSKT